MPLVIERHDGESFQIGDAYIRVALSYRDGFPKPRIKVFIWAPPELQVTRSDAKVRQPKPSSELEAVHGGAAPERLLPDHRHRT